MSEYLLTAAQFAIYTTPHGVLNSLSMKNENLNSITGADTPAPLRNLLDRELPDCEDLVDVARRIRDRLNEVLKKDADEYIFELAGDVFAVFKNGKKVVEVKQLPND